MADGVRKGLSQRFRRIEGIIHPFEAVGLDTARYGQVFLEEALGLPQEFEGIAVELPVVQKLVGAGSAAESRYA